jgi:gluconate 2-dehydrogenase gamma chain
MPTSRRKVIKSIAVAAVSAPLAAQHIHPGASEFVQVATPVAAYKPKFFSSEQLQTVRLLADLIIPRTDTPGAADAGVHNLIDSDTSRKPAVQQLWKEALAWFDAESQRRHGQPFAKASQEQQTAILTGASASPTAAGFPHFALLKSATVDTYYATRQGLQTELGWNANTYLPEFAGCTHKEHQG